MDAWPATLCYSLGPLGGGDTFMQGERCDVETMAKGA